jgi:hypothetical protein
VIEQSKKPTAGHAPHCLEVPQLSNMVQEVAQQSIHCLSITTQRDWRLITDLVHDPGSV